MIYVGIDDTDIIGTPGTNQLARAMLKRLDKAADGAVICRHQLFFDPRVPYTSKNGSASIQLPGANGVALDRLIEVLREVMRGWFVAGSDPGLCVAAEVSEEVKAFGLRCKGEVVTQDEARALAARAGCYLEGLGGTEQGVIGALAAIGLVAGGQDGRVVHLASWPYPDDFSGLHDMAEIQARGVADIRQFGFGSPVTLGLVDVGKRLRPSWRDGRIVLYVVPSTAPEAAAPWSAVKLP
ncbi:MAG: ABC transporter substrate-binding protein [Acidobacteriia bacterium]|nr:ABC transporter substrate-binding protein [Terriglobia bacterium]